MSIQSRTICRHLGVAGLVISLTACGQSDPLQRPPTSPSPPVPPTGVTLSGIASEFTEAGDRRPVAHLRLKVWRAGPHDGAVGGVELADTVTDADGRYTINDVPPGILFFQTVSGSEYRLLCGFYPVVVPVRSSLPFRDLPVVHAAWSGKRLPQGMWIVGTSVYGTVSERVDGTVRPVADATVSLDDGMQDPAATTTATGFYMICSVVGSDQPRQIAAQKSGFDPLTRQIFGGWDREINLELTRK